MKGDKAQNRARVEFLSALDTADRIYGPAREMCVFDYESFNHCTYHPNVAAKVIGLAFLSAVAAWEDFVEDLYLGYLSGYPAPNGYLPKLRAGRALNKSHALLVAAGERNPRDAERKLRWSSFKWVRSLSEVHFDRDNVFCGVSVRDVELLELAQTLRNRIAHNSDKAKRQYKVAINRLVGQADNDPLPGGFAPGKFLICSTDCDPALEGLCDEGHYWGNVFEGYLSFWRRLAFELCPGDVLPLTRQIAEK